MKRFPGEAFPVLFALFSSTASIIFYRFHRYHWNCIPLLVFFSALGWSAMILFRDKRWLKMKIIYLLFSILGSISSVEWIWRPSENLFLFRLVYILTITGILLIRVYFQILDQRRPE